ncbi:hypothetical protein F3J10_20185 [Burkholderia sp. Cy-637]|nr:hypothetical protein [Burkholderia sp. Cy-637]
MDGVVAGSAGGCEPCPRAAGAGPGRRARRPRPAGGARERTLRRQRPPHDPARAGADVGLARGAAPGA